MREVPQKREEEGKENLPPKSTAEAAIRLSTSAVFQRIQRKFLKNDFSQMFKSGDSRDVVVIFLFLERCKNAF